MNVMPTSVAARRPPTTSAAPQRPLTAAAPLNCLSVDVEEYFHGEVFARCLSPSAWPRQPRRAAACVERLATLFERYESRGTFFVLGWTVAYLAPLLRALVQQGHEIACHGQDHQHIGRLTPQQLRDDLAAARRRIEDAVGVTVRGYRAPTFSVTLQTAWALDAIIDAGFDYDSSIFPIRHDRYGIPAAPRTPFRAVAPSGRSILELPPLTAQVGPLRLPVGGGGYLRLLPAAVIRHCVGRSQRRGDPVMLYVHPWELDPDQPRLPIGPLAQWRHRVNLDKTAGKVERLLQQFRFRPAGQIADILRANPPRPLVDFAV